MSRIVQGIWCCLQISAAFNTHGCRSSGSRPRIAPFHGQIWISRRRRLFAVGQKAGRAAIRPKVDFCSFCSRGYWCQPKSKDIIKFLGQFWTFHINKLFWIIKLQLPHKPQKSANPFCLTYSASWRPTGIFTSFMVLLKTFTRTQKAFLRPHRFCVDLWRSHKAVCCESF